VITKTVTIRAKENPGNQARGALGAKKEVCFKKREWPVAVVPPEMKMSTTSSSRV
jgi:hypothetical protein